MKYRLYELIYCSKFNGQKSTGIRKPVSPNELLQLQKTNKSENDKQVLRNKDKQLKIYLK